MSGVPLFNFPAFDRAEEILRDQGHSVVNPARIDREHGFDPIGLPSNHDWSVIPHEAGPLKIIVDRDLDALVAECTAIYMLNGWENSKGARAEKAVAEWMGYEVMYETPPEATPAKDILLEAYEITTGDRQNSYGPPDQDFRRTADMWTGLFRDMLKDGVAFKPFHIAQAMILLKMSRQLHQRKSDNWIDCVGYARCGWLCDQAETK
jgi:hypothetical protein